MLALGAAGVHATGTAASWVLTHPASSEPAPVASAAESTTTAEPAVPSEPQVSAEPTISALPSRPATMTIAADIAVGDLESTISDLGAQNAEKDYTFKGDPRGIDGLTLAGFDFLSLANNLVLDCGPEAMLDSIARLDAAGIGHAGAGADKTAARTPAIREIDGTTVAFLGFSHILPAGFVATDNKTGEAFILEAELGHAGVANVRAVPVYLDDTYGIPDHVTGPEADAVLERLKVLSAERGTTVAIEGDTARVLP